MEPVQACGEPRTAYGCTDGQPPTSTLWPFTTTVRVEFVYGCMDETQFNYNPEVKRWLVHASHTAARRYSIQLRPGQPDDGGIEYAYGCTDDTHSNYDPLANTDDGTCIEFIYGCTDDTINYNPAANTDDGARIEFIYGCNETVFNYDAGANTNDGTCMVGGSCVVRWRAMGLEHL